MAVAQACGQAVVVAHVAGHSRQIERYTRKGPHRGEAGSEIALAEKNVPPRFREYVYGKEH